MNPHPMAPTHCHVTHRSSALLGVLMLLPIAFLRPYLVGVDSWLRGNDQYGKAILEESQSIWLQLGSDGEPGLASGCICLGEIMIGIESDKNAAQAYFEQSFGLYEKLEDKAGMNRAMYGLAHIAMAEGNYVEAEERLTNCLAISKDLGDRFAIAVTCGELGTVAQLRDEYERAYKLHELCITSLREQPAVGIVFPIVLFFVF